MPNISSSRRAATAIALLAALALGGSSVAAAGSSSAPPVVSAAVHAGARVSDVVPVALRVESSTWAAAAGVVLGGAAIGAASGASAGARALPGQALRSHAAPPGTYAGRNHVWIPSLGISRAVHLFECTRKREPDNLMYRWGCAGSNNVYLLGHAYGVMKPLHDAYVTGRLQVGMLAFYADGDGHIRAYAVTEWRVVDPVDSGWAIASQPVPSMTLQTCVGPKGVLRLNVRLVEVPM